jgi:hypothetical protein
VYSDGLFSNFRRAASVNPGRNLIDREDRMNDQIESAVGPGPSDRPVTLGARRAEPAFFRMKSPVLATVLSAMPGLGQAYLGYYRQGFINIVVVGALISALNRGVGSAEPFCGLFLAFFWLFNLVDAARKATYFNQALAGATELPEELPASDRRDSLIAGVAMIGFGGLLLANSRWGVSLEWVLNWWPLILVLTGAYLVGSYMLDQKKAGRVG